MARGTIVLKPSFTFSSTGAYAQRTTQGQGARTNTTAYCTSDQQRRASEPRRTRVKTTRDIAATLTPVRVDSTVPTHATAHHGTSQAVTATVTRCRSVPLSSVRCPPTRRLGFAIASASASTLSPRLSTARRRPSHEGAPRWHTRVIGHCGRPRLSGACAARTHTHGWERVLAALAPEDAPRAAANASTGALKRLHWCALQL